MSLASSLKKDPSFVELRKIVAAASKGFNGEAILDEAKTLHQGRKSRGLRRVTMAPTPLYDAAMNDLSNRSRLVELRVSLMSLCSTVEDATKTFSQMVTATYASEMKDEGLSTQATRQAFLNTFLEPAVNLRREMESVMEVLDVYIKDIDQAGYHLKLATDVLTLAHGRRGQGEA